MGPLTIEFLGHSSFRLHHACCGWVYLDPWLEGNPACGLKADQVAEARYVCVSHGHRDHLGDALPICRQTGALLISTPEICAFASRHGVAYEKQSHGLNIGGTARFHDFAVTMVHAFHTSEIQGPAYAADRSLEPGSGAAGFMFDFAGRHCLYYTGDTGVFGDMHLFAQLYRPNVLILPVGGKYTMGPREAAAAVRMIQPAVCIPCHYNTYPNQQIDLAALAELFSQASPTTRLEALPPGGKLMLES